MNYRMLLTLPGFIFCSILSAYGQKTVDLTGPTSSELNVVKKYRLVWRDAITNDIVPPPAFGSAIWSTTGGTVSNDDNKYADVLWTSGGTQLLIFEHLSFDGYYYDDLSVMVAVPPPATPNPTFTHTQNCNATVVQRNSNPPTGVKWYWQTSSTGTNTSDSSSSISISSSGNLYLRGRNITSPYSWSDSSQLVGDIVVVATPPSVPATATHGEIISDTGGQVPISVSTVSGATSYRWYEIAIGGSPISGASTESYSPNVSVTKTFHVEAVNGNCPSTSRKAVTANVHPAAAISSTNNSVIAMGVPVTLSLNYTYDTYQWKHNGTNISGATGSTYQTSLPGSYTVVVSKGTATGVISIPKLIGTGLSGQNMNYIVSNTMLRAGVTESDIDTLSVQSMSQAIQYFDGLGRPMQTVVTQGSPNKKDIVQPVVYDQFGREARKYLPYVATSNDGWYKANPVGTTSYNGSAHHTFYNETNSLIARDAKPYSETIFEASPLNRVIKQGAPGTTWQPDGTHTYASTDHTVKMSYEFNAASEVLLWTFTYPTEQYTKTAVNAFGKVNAGTAAAPIFYAANQLYKNMTKDEHGNQVVEYVDKQGRTILKRVQAKSGTPPATTGTNKDSDYASTYYIYDDFGNLVCVIPPEATKRLATEYYQSGSSDATKNTFLKRWAFRYRYDGRKRMIMKQVPGAEPVYMVYDNRDRLVLTQDGNQRTDASGNITKKEWAFTKYDALNRPVMTGIYLHATVVNHQTMSGLISTSSFVESYDQTKPHGYTTTIFPNTNLTVHTVTFYDNYDFRDDLIAGTNYDFNSSHLTGQETTAFDRVKGQVTGTKVNVLGTGNYLWTVNYYDDRYRVIQSVMQNYKGGQDRITSIYDFVGKVLKTKSTHVTTSESTDITRILTYDHAGRLLKTYHQVDEEDEVLLSRNEYNELGQLVTKKLHSEDEGATFKQHVDYRFNIRQWLTRINNADLTPDEQNEPRDYFGMNLHYNDQDFALGNASYFDGNISAIKWSTNLGLGFNDAQLNIFEPTQRAYKFTYDALHRLKAASHVEKTTGWNPTTAYLEEVQEYDHNGNIKALTRKGKNGSNMDLLTYNYGTGATASNKLLAVTDAGDRTEGFKEAGTTATDYVYDNNGNMVWDRNKGGAEILTNGSFENGNSDWTLTDTESRLIFTNNEVQITAGSVTAILQQTVITKSKPYVVVIDIERTAGTLTVNAGGATSNLTATGQFVLSMTAGTSHNDFRITAGTTFAGKIKSVSVKGVTVLTYNYLNQPEIVTQAGDQQLQFIYDATGKKLAQILSKNGEVKKRDDYVGEFIYKNDTLQFIQHEEGRVNMLKAEPIYEYVLRDHLGNTRITLTTKHETETFTATLEDNTFEEEQNTFSSYNSFINPVLNHTAGGERAHVLNGGYNGQVGLAKSFAVVPGDTIRANVYAKYISGTGQTGNLANFAAAITSAFNLTPGMPGEAGTMYEALNSFGAIIAAGGRDDEENAPKGFINILVFDKDFNLVDFAYRQIDVASTTSHELLSVESPIRHAGYAYVFLSNENPTEVQIGFDDYEVTHAHSDVIQQSAYYPFGLTFDDYQKENSLEQRWKFQKQEHVNDMGLGWVSFKWRNAMPELGRFFNVDPLSEKYVHNSTYAFSENKVTGHIELEGLESLSANYFWQKAGKEKVGGKTWSDWQHRSTKGEKIGFFAKFVGWVAVNIGLSYTPIGAMEGTAAKSTASKVVANKTPKKFVFRGDSRKPSEIFDNGFKSKGSNMDLPEHAKTNPSNSGYVSTSESPNVAREFADEGGHVYTIEKPADGVNVNEALGSSSPFPAEQEIAVPNEIPSSNIVGARKVGKDGKFEGPFIKNNNKTKKPENE